MYLDASRVLPSQTGTLVNDLRRRNTALCMAEYYDRKSSCRIGIKKYDHLQTNKDSFAFSTYRDHMKSCFTSFLFVYCRILPFLVTEIYDLNTKRFKTTKYGRIQKYIRKYMAVYERVRTPYSSSWAKRFQICVGSDCV